MDALEVVVVASPFANLSPIYEVDPEADTLLIVPPQHSTEKPFAAWDESTTTTSSPSNPGLRLKVSSRHLSLASRAFRNKLQHHATNKKSTQSDGRIHLSLLPSEGFDPKAVQIVMNILHGRGSKVPKSLEGGIDLLAKIALFVDRFGLLDAVEVYAERWIAKLSASLPAEYSRDLILWLYTSHVFRDPEIFNKVSKTLAAVAPGPIKTLGLPIREGIVRDIDAQRQALVGAAVDKVHGVLETLQDERQDAACERFHCDSFLLGELVKTLHRQKLLWPKPAKPFLGTSFVGVADAVGLLSSSGGGGGVFEKLGAPVWGVKKENKVVNGHAHGHGQQPPLTPDASPDPARHGNGNPFDFHECEARRLVDALPAELGELVKGVKGLELVSRNGYQLYN